MESLGTVLAAASLDVMYLLAGRLRAVQARFPRRWLSLAAGVSVAYVFVDILPELGARNRGLVEAAGGGLLFAEQRLYLGALAGFVFLYGLDHLLLASRAHGKTSHGGAAGDSGLWFHLGGYALYSWLVGYLLMSRADRGWPALGLYASAMLFHLAVVGTALAREHGRSYDRWGRWLLAASVPAGWLIGTTLPMADIVISRLFAFVAGGVVITSLIEELPRDDRQGRFGWFVLGAAAYTIVLLLAA